MKSLLFLLQARIAIDRRCMMNADRRLPNEFAPCSPAESACERNQILPPKIAPFNQTVRVLATCSLMCL